MKGLPPEAASGATSATSPGPGERASPDAGRRAVSVGLAGLMLVPWVTVAATGAPTPSKPKSEPGKGKVDPNAAKDQGFQTAAETALLTDYDSGTVLFEKNPDQPFSPASLTKMMTVAVVAQMIKDGKLTLEQEYPISEHAWRTGGAPSRTATMFAEINSRLKVADLLQGTMVVSGNDGAIALAEGIAGNESAFSELMNRRAKELGMDASAFGNPTGLPDQDNRVTARDLEKLARHLIADHAEIYKYYALREFTNTVSKKPIRQLSRNPLFSANLGADGLTGQVKEPGYNIVGSAVQNGQRLILVMSGLKSDKDRADESKKLMEWGFRNFEQFVLYQEGESPGDAAVYGGASGSVRLVADKPIRVLAARGHRDRLKARVIYRGPIPAPVTKGTAVGKLQVLRDDSVIQETPLFTADDVPVGKLHQRALDAVSELVTTWIRGSVGLK